ncbi:HypC/HybG/HupF family hydrogenase formation chaperone [Nocardioides sp. InS609-2]|uniref:HypC/HybG/HupF family hydrogenase formation chaperone n=1 Tax=Nocardioides sp. InS609-2 TaxID=2760705 RepID=UPI0020BF35ED|nr:HypC/HybG/HupF family hydrogenase formation chaperone [Nocardioides sp. InS609-2]
MCLGIPGKVVEVSTGTPASWRSSTSRTQRKINIGMLDDPPATETWVLINMGFALETVDEVAAAEAMSGLEMVGRERDG